MTAAAAASSAAASRSCTTRTRAVMYGSPEVCSTISTRSPPTTTTFIRPSANRRRRVVRMRGAPDSRDSVVGGQREHERLRRSACSRRSSCAVAGLEDVERDALAGQQHHAEREEAEVALVEIRHEFSVVPPSRPRCTIEARRWMCNRSRPGSSGAALDAVDPYEPGRPIESRPPRDRHRVGDQARVQRGAVPADARRARRPSPTPPRASACTPTRVLGAARRARAAHARADPPDPARQRGRQPHQADLPRDHRSRGPGRDGLAVVPLVAAGRADPGGEVGRSSRSPPTAPTTSTRCSRRSARAPSWSSWSAPTTRPARRWTPAALVAFLDRLPPHVLPVLDEAYFEYLPEGGHDGAALVRDGRRWR